MSQTSLWELPSIDDIRYLKLNGSAHNYVQIIRHVLDQVNHEFTTRNRYANFWHVHHSA